MRGSQSADRQASRRHRKAIADARPDRDNTMKHANRRQAAPQNAIARSSLVRRLISARNDPAKQRIRNWMSVICEVKLLNFGLSAGDIELLRASARKKPACTGERYRGGDR
jgi:hypothetical protein